MRTSLLFLAAAAAAAASLSPSALAQYEYVDLGTLGGDASGALGINDAGQVVGWSSIPGCTTANGFPCRRAFLWEAGVGMTDLGVLAGDEDSVARGINNAGLIVGTSESDVIAGSGVFHGCSWDSGTLSPLPDLGSGQSFVSDVNDSGTIVGYAPDPNNLLRDRVVTWQDGVITNQGDSAGYPFNRGYGINEQGHLVGFAWVLLSPNDSILFDGTDWHQIGGFGQFENSEAQDLSDSGVVVGLQAFPDGDWHPAMWFGPGQPATDLGMLPGLSLGEMTAVNESNQAVGFCYDDTDSRAVFYDGAQMVDMNTLLSPGVNVQLLEAHDINESGEIVGLALDGGQVRAFLLRPDQGGPYCDATANSTGAPSVLSVSGSTSILANDLELQASSLPDQPTLFYYGSVSVQVPFGDGLRCVGGQTVRLNPAILPTGGVATRQVDTIVEGFSPGSVYFQAWYRDPAAMGSGFNLSNGYEVVFTP